MVAVPAVGADGAHLFGQRIVGGEDRAAIPVAAQRLGREETRAGDRRDAATAPPVAGGAETLRPVLDDRDPVAGADGTLSNRFKGSTAQRNAFLKTGTLTGVRSLAGYVRGKSGRMIAVAIVVNSERATAAVPAMDRFIEWAQENG